MCCGKKRRQLVAGRVSTLPRVGKPTGKPVVVRRAGRSKVYFRYTGRTGLLVRGGKTGRRYRFSHPGAVLPVDPADRRSLITVPNLRQVRSP